MQFFRYFPTIPYTVTLDDGTEQVFTMTEIEAHVQIVQKLRQNLTVFYDYLIQDGQRPDSVAQSVYGSVNYTWVVLLVNGIFSLYDWPLSSDEFENYITDKYGSVANAQAIPVYTTADGVTIDAITFNLLPAAERNQDTMYDFELAQNDAKRQIKVIPIEFIAPLVTNLQQILSS